MKYAISACLIGCNCKYNGGNNRSEELLRIVKDTPYITICPEVSGGLPIPRASCEIRKGRVYNTCGEDVSEAFQRGACKEVQRVLAEQVDLVILQPRSPSCGVGTIYDGSFTGTLIAGDGIFAQHCRKWKIPVISLPDFLAQHAKKLDGGKKS